MAGGSRKVTKKSNMKPFFNVLVECKKDCAEPKRRIRETMTVPADCGARHENKRNTGDLMLAAPDQCFVKRLDIKVHVGSWYARPPAQE